MASNFDFLQYESDTRIYYQSAIEAEKQYSQEMYTAEFVTLRKMLQKLVEHTLELNGIEVPEYNTFDQNLSLVKKYNLLSEVIIDRLYKLKKVGNISAHQMNRDIGQENALSGLKEVFYIFAWFVQKNYKRNVDVQSFEEPKSNIYETSERKLIYVQTVDNKDGNFDIYEGLEKIGDASITDFEIDGHPNSNDLREIAGKRIKQYMTTAGLPFDLQWAELAYRKNDKTWFRDYDVHKVLQKSGVKKAESLKGNEWFKTDLETIKEAITAVKEGKTAINVENNDKKANAIVLRPEQKEAIEVAKKAFKKYSKRKKDSPANHVLWNAKMRFGKTITALELVKEMKFEKVLIMTHRPVVSDSWYEDFRKLNLANMNYTYGSRDKGLTLEELFKGDNPFIYFASIQDLQGSYSLGGNVSNKNKLVSKIDWDLIIIDEAHEGTMTDKTQTVLNHVLKEDTKVLELSGTPFNLIDKYEDDQIFTWDYVMEQQAKEQWYQNHPNEKNPYEMLPKVNMYTFEMNKNFGQSEFIDPTNRSFKFSEFFRVDEQGNFIYEREVKRFLDNITTPNKKTNYPYSTPEFRDKLRHTLWILPSRSSAKALEKLMNSHPVFGMDYEVINVVDKDDNQDEDHSKNDLERVRNAIGDDPTKTRTITLTVRKLTTGVNIPQWTGVMFLSNTNSAMQYLQAAFRAQTPYSHEKFGMKTNCYIFDFAPDRALTIMSDSVRLSSGAGKLATPEQKYKMGELLNFLPIIGEQGHGMKEYRVDTLLTKLKKVYAEKAVQTGFDDDSIYSDELLKLDYVDINDFNNLKAIVGTTKKEKKATQVDVNSSGLTDEEYEKAEKGKKKAKKERTPEEQDAIDKMNQLKKQKKTMISILRSISVRIPMMIYGMDIDLSDDVDINTFIHKVDDKSWEEFMPKGVTKELFKKFSKYYDSDIFIEAGRIIRNKVKQLDNVDPLERVEQIAMLFGTFKNPDKETVLTPWRIVNMQLGKTLGGLSHYDEDYEETSINGVKVRRWVNTNLTDKILENPDTHYLEINSKTGLYPLYIVASMYQLAFEKLNEETAGRFSYQEQEQLWEEILKNNIFVIAKTPMAKTITERTLSGYKNYEMNVKFIDHLVEEAKENINDLANKISKEFKGMKFDVVIGNPPYQQDDKNGKGSGTPIYQHFVELSKKLSPRYITLITPSVWFTGGKGLDKYRYNMLNDNHLKAVYNFETPKEIFPTANLRGGVNFFLWDKNYNSNNIFVESINNGKIISSGYRPIYAENLELFIANNKSYFLLCKLIDKGLNVDLYNSNNFSSIVSARNPYALTTNFKKNQNFKSSKDSLKNPVKVYASDNTVGYVERGILKKGIENIDKIKVFTAFANNIGTDLSDDNLNLIIGKDGSVCTETFLEIGCNLNLTLNEAENIGKYLKTKFVRFLISLIKANQNGTRKTYRLVPMQDFSNDSDIDWDKSIKDINIQLYKKYNLSDDDINFIETQIKEIN